MSKKEKSKKSSSPVLNIRFLEHIKPGRTTLHDVLDKFTKLKDISRAQAAQGLYYSFVILRKVLSVL